MADVTLIPEEFLQCRDVRHAWDYYDVFLSRHRKTRRNELNEQLLCTRCTAIKTRHLHPSTGMVVRPATTKYPKGYLRDGQGALTPADRGKLALLHADKAKRLKAAQA